ncbi:MAG: ABC transporter ATP-binding protein [Pseudomonadota bacterium]
MAIGAVTLMAQHAVSAELSSNLWQPESISMASKDKPARKTSAFDAASRNLMRRFFDDWVRPRWHQLRTVMVLTALLAAATGGYPLVIEASFDALLGASGSDQTIYFVLAAIIGITCTRALLLYFQTVASTGLVQRIATELQKVSFAHAMGADFATLTRTGPGQMVSKLTNDVQFIQNAAQATLNTAVRDLLMIVALVGAMIWLDPIMTFVVLCVYPIAAIPIAIISERLRKVAKRTQNELGDMTAQLTEKLSGARLIKTFRLEDYATSTVHGRFEEVFRLKMKAVRNRARLDPMLEALGGLAVAGVVILAYWRISTGVATVGDFMGFVTALLMAAQPIRGLGNLGAKIAEGLAGAESIYKLLDEPPRVADVPDARPLTITQGEIDFSNVSFSYEGASGAAPAVRDVMMTVPGGKTVALVGPSGAGKSTILNLVPRLFDLTHGRIKIDGQDIRNVTLASLRGSISIVSQDVTLFDDTIAANIGLGRLDASREEIYAAAEAAAAHKFIVEQPDGYETRIGDRGLRLSGGQRQRLALARAILKDAPILLLDEATSALDTESERLVQTALARFTKGRTTLVIAHRLSTIRHADLICVFAEGRLTEMGTHNELLTRHGVYAGLANAQAMDPDATNEPANGVTEGASIGPTTGPKIGHGQVAAES